MIGWLVEQGEYNDMKLHFHLITVVVIGVLSLLVRSSFTSPLSGSAVSSTKMPTPTHRPSAASTPELVLHTKAYLPLVNLTFTPSGVPTFKHIFSSDT